MPYEHWIGRVSEEFGGLPPSAVLAELDRLPVGLIETILEYRQCARAITAYERDPHAPGPLVRLVKEVDFEMTQEEIARKTADGKHTHV